MNEIEIKKLLLRIQKKKKKSITSFDLALKNLGVSVLSKEVKS